MLTCPRCGEAVPSPSSPPSLRCSAEVFALLGPALGRRKQERFFAIGLDARNRVISRHLVAVGSLTTCIISPREVFAPLIRRHAAAAILAHNHPSGEPSPSAEDIELTRRLADAGKLLGIAILDHIVIGGDSYYSFRDAGALS